MINNELSDSSAAASSDTTKICSMSAKNSQNQQKNNASTMSHEQVLSKELKSNLKLESSQYQLTEEQNQKGFQIKQGKILLEIIVQKLEDNQVLLFKTLTLNIGTKLQKLSLTEIKLPILIRLKLNSAEVLVNKKSEIAPGMILQMEKASILYSFEKYYKKEKNEFMSKIPLFALRPYQQQEQLLVTLWSIPQKMNILIGLTEFNHAKSSDWKEMNRQI